jgi:predicted nucleic acid-binding protein
VSGFVCIDACVAVKWVVPEADSDRALALYQRIADEGDTIIVPPHMPVEVVQALWKKRLRKELTPAEADSALATFLEFRLSLASPAGLYEASWQLAQRFDRPTVYDTQYVALAEIAGCQLWTADIKLVNALNGKLPFVKPLAAVPV